MFIGKEFESSNAFIAYPFDEASHQHLNFDAHTPDYASDARLPADALLDIALVVDSDFCGPVYLQALAYDAAGQRVHATIGCAPSSHLDADTCETLPGLNGGFGDDPSRPGSHLVAKVSSTGVPDADFGGFARPAYGTTYTQPLYGYVSHILPAANGGRYLRGSIGIAGSGVPNEGLVKLLPDGTPDTGFAALRMPGVPPEQFAYMLREANTLIEAYGYVLFSTPYHGGLIALDADTGQPVNPDSAVFGMPVTEPGWQGRRVLSLAVVAGGTAYADITVPQYNSSGTLVSEARYLCVRVPPDLSAPDLTVLDADAAGRVPYSSVMLPHRDDGGVLLHTTEQASLNLIDEPPVRYAPDEYATDQLQPDLSWTWPAGLQYTGIKPLADGSVLVYGTSGTVATGTPDEYEYEYEYEYADYTRRKLIKLTATGAVDLAFTLDPRVENYVVGTQESDILDRVTAVAEQPDGRILVAMAGFTSGCYAAVVLRLLPDGGLDESFNPFSPVARQAVTPSGALVELFPDILAIDVDEGGDITLGGAFHPADAAITLDDGVTMSFRLSSDGREMHTEPGSEISARAVVTPSLTAYLSARGGSESFNADRPLRFDASVVDRRAARVDSVSIRAPYDTVSRLLGDVALVAGYNIALRTTAGGIQIDALPGAGAGKAPCNTAPTPSGDHDLQIVGDGCYEIAPKSASQLVISGGCDACCDCEDYLAILEAIAALRTENAALARRINEAVAKYNALLVCACTSDRAIQFVPRGTELIFEEETP